MTHIIAKHYLKEIKISVTDFATKCHIDTSTHLLNFNNELNFVIPENVYEDLMEYSVEKTLH